MRILIVEDDADAGAAMARGLGEAGHACIHVADGGALEGEAALGFTESEIAAWYIREGQRARGEDLLAKALAKNPDEVWHYIRTAEAFLGVPSGR